MKKIVFISILCAVLIIGICAIKVLKCNVTLYVRQGESNGLSLQISSEKIKVSVCDVDALSLGIRSIPHKLVSYHMSDEERLELKRKLGEIRIINCNNIDSNIKDGPKVKVSYMGRRYMTNFLPNKLALQSNEVNNDKIINFVSYVLDITNAYDVYDEYLKSE